MTGIHCAAHVLQLNIMDILKHAWDDEATETYIQIIQSAQIVLKNLQCGTIIFPVKIYSESLLVRIEIGCFTEYSIVENQA